MNLVLTYYFNKGLKVSYRKSFCPYGIGYNGVVEYPMRGKGEQKWRVG